MRKFALEYLNRWKFSVIPLKPDKRPLIKWEEFQKKYPTKDDINRWWVKYPNSLIGIITGKISGIVVVDVDTKEIPLFIQKMRYETIPTVETPRGFHFYFKYREGITNTVNVGGKKIDIRGEGGYVVAPPSKIDVDKQYRWINGLYKGLPEFPIEILSQSETVSEKSPSTGLEPTEVFIEGRRDNDLFHTANLLIKNGMEEAQVKDVISRLATTCDPPFSQKEAETKVESAIKRAMKKERSLAQETENWISVTEGYFSVTDIQRALHIVTPEEKNNLRQIVHRLKKRDMIESYGQKHDTYRLIERECTPMDWENAPIDEVPLKFPLELEEYVKIYPKNIIVIAGESNAGKTSWALEFIRLNQDKHTIHYFNSEMGETELKIRLGLFQNVKEWKFNAWERGDNFEDVIYPDSINIVDYIDVTEDFARIGTPIKRIHEKLNKGIAILMIQKNPDRYDIKRGEWIATDYGVGGAKSIGKSRLYLSMGHGKIKVVKAKGWRGTDNPNGMIREFKLYSGWQFEGVSYWGKPTKD